MTPARMHTSASPAPGRHFRQSSGCHAGEVVHVLGRAPHFDGYWLVEAECGKRWAMRERVLRSRLHHGQ